MIDAKLFTTIYICFFMLLTIIPFSRNFSISFFFVDLEVVGSNALSTLTIWSFEVIWSIQSMYLLELKSRLASLSRALRDKKKYTNEKSKLLFQKYVLIFPICLSFPMMINRFPLKRFCVFSSEYTWECVYIISLQFINLKGSWASVKSKHMSPVWKARERNDSLVCGWVICFPVQKSSELTLTAM